MFDLKAKMLNRQASGPKSKPEAILHSLGIGQGQSVADIGSGGGYFSLRFAGLVGKDGKVYAVDIDPGLLGYVRKKGAEAGLSNLFIVQAESASSSVPPMALSLIFARNVYHHLPDPAGYFSRMKKCLVPGGRLAIIDYREKGQGFSLHSLFDRRVPAGKVKQEMAEAGYVLERTYDFLPEQYFLVFKIQ